LLAIAMLAGLLGRGVVFSQTAGLGIPIIDEQHYTSIAGNLINRHEFSMISGQPTSIRPPLYPAFLAAIWSIAGEHNYQAVRLVQGVLSAVTAWLVFLIGRDFFSPRAGRIAAAVFWLYPSFIFFNVTILTETLYTLLLVSFVWLTAKVVVSPRPQTAVLAGVALGLACLTRSSLWPLPILLCPLLVAIIKESTRDRLATASLFLVGYAIVVAPWAVRNTRLQGQLTIVDTMGGVNLRLGNYEHTPEDRMWDAVSLEGEKNWAYELRKERPGPFTEGEKDKWAQARAVEYIAAHPWTTMRRSLIRLADFWGLEREYLAGVDRGHYLPPRWFALVVSALTVVAYVGVALSAVGGVWLTRSRDWRVDLVLLMPSLAIMAAHAIVFGHSRYHAPLVPVLALYAAAFWNAWPWPLGDRRLAVAGATACALLLLTVWGRQTLFIDAERIQGFLAHVR
jgi:4-amino-4-deoxy-L-arabinose transferase-like glycosyltransferase